MGMLSEVAQPTAAMRAQMCFQWASKPGLVCTDQFAGSAFQELCPLHSCFMWGVCRHFALWDLQDYCVSQCFNYLVTLLCLPQLVWEKIETPSALHMVWAAPEITFWGKHWDAVGRMGWGGWVCLLAASAPHPRSEPSSFPATLCVESFHHCYGTFWIRGFLSTAHGCVEKSAFSRREKRLQQLRRLPAALVKEKWGRVAEALRAVNKTGDVISLRSSGWCLVKAEEPPEPLGWALLCSTNSNRACVEMQGKHLL